MPVGVEYHESIDDSAELVSTRHHRDEPDAGVCERGFLWRLCGAISMVSLFPNDHLGEVRSEEAADERDVELDSVLPLAIA